MDVKGLAGNLGLEEDEYLELLELFLERTESNLDKLRSGIDTGDTQEVVASSHSIKGSSANLGLEKIFEVAKGVEEKARQNGLEGAAEAVKFIKEQCDQIAGEIKAA